MPRLRSNPGAEKRRAERAGRRAETLAALYLRMKLFRILAKRFKTPVGEIDIVARRGRLLVFAEVKHRKTPGAAALEAVHQSRIARAAQWFMMSNPQFSGFDCRIDVIVLAPGHWPYHLENAFSVS
ncbi:YraN family protein [Pelagibacterium limicola]|uniref:YraN family protein n=1 Tax=Pelagibacterium limicola TaxID=2791022 RepID=UPI0018AF860C|nr:YraN family protein [Pelagibacterium limicola]